MYIDSVTIRELLQQELDRRSHASNMTMDVEEMFDKPKITMWISKLIGKDRASLLAERINNTTVERLAHAASTYLLGIAIRDNLAIRFDKLPRLISNGTGDGFHFFWAMICLCHDIGYIYENHEYRPDEIGTVSKVIDILKIENNLFEVNRAQLEQLGIDVNGDDGKWILDVIDLAKGYDAYRRTNNGGRRLVIDHGIAGALILYDILYREYCSLSKVQRDTREEYRKRNNSHESMGALDGVSKDTSLLRFITCSLIIACTVARHNMWLAKEDESDKKAQYAVFGLQTLCADNPLSQIRAVSPQNQMLFLLDYIDTIDPVKGIYLRDLEWGGFSDQELKLRKNFVLDNVQIKFIGNCNKGYRWGNSLIYRKFEVFVDQDKNSLFINYAKRTSGLADWLDTKAPIINGTKISFYLPTYQGKENFWMAGITDQEVNALLLYEGCGVPGKYGAFYSSSKAYQSFNLLMMPGSTGEVIRVCTEGQEPSGLYIQQWQKTLEVLTDIFSAQCKYAVHCQKYALYKEDKIHSTEVLYRADREANVQLMMSGHRTFALTSTSKGGYLHKFLKNKIGPHVLRINIDENIPYFDYEGFFGDQYIFTEELEVLLPPYIQIEATAGEIEHDVNLGTIQHYNIHLTKFLLQDKYLDEERLIQYLNDNAETAANGLKNLVDTKDITTLPDNHIYWKWKESFQQLCHICMDNIFRNHFDTNK